MNRLAQWTVKIQTILSHFCKQSKIVPFVIAQQHKKGKKKKESETFYINKKEKYEFQNGRNRPSPRCPT